MQSTTPFFGQLPNEITRKILKKAARSASDERAISQVNHSFNEKLPTIKHISGSYSRWQGMHYSIFFNHVLKFACQRVDNLQARHPQLPIRIMAEQSGESTNNKLPVCDSLIVTDVRLEELLRCDVSKIHTLVFGLTDRQYKYELTSKFAGVVQFFTINKFPSLKSLVLNNVNLTDELLKCFQEYNLEFFHLWYYSVYNNFDEKYDGFENYLKNFETLSVKEFRIDTSVNLMFPSMNVVIPPTMEKLTLNINPVMHNPYGNNKGKITFNAEKSDKLEIFQFYCHHSFIGTLGFRPCLAAGQLKKFAADAKPNQMKILRNEMNPNFRWGLGVVKLCMHPDIISHISIPFPKCRVPTSYYTSDKTRTAKCTCRFRGLF